MKNLKLGVIVLLTLFSIQGYSQFVNIVNKKFVVNGNAGCSIYFNGANTPWESWNDFGGAYNATKWAQDMADLKTKGINAARIWFSCDGNGQPSVATDGTVSAPTAAFWTNCDHLFTLAQTNGVYIMATMMSFDHTKTGNVNAANWRAMMSDTAKIRTYLNNYLIPFVNRYKTNPYLFSIDICNEIEWIAEDGTNWKTTYPVLQRFVAMCCVAMHSSAIARADGSKVLVTLGSAATKWNGTKMRNGSYGTGWQNNADGNKWSDAALQSVYSNVNATLDFYSPHFYGWINEYYSNMFEKSPTDFGMDDKACMVGEMPARDPFPIPTSSTVKTNMTMTTAMNNLKTLGWQGHMPWTANLTTNLTTEVGTLADFGAAALAFKNANAALVVPTCVVVINHTPPSCVITAPHNNAYFQAGTDVQINVYSSGVGGSFTAGTISKVEFFNGSIKIGEDLTGTSNTFSFLWTTVPAGTYTITTKSTDNTGAVSTSAGLLITVGTTAVTKIGLSPCKGKYLANVIAGGVRSDYSTYWNGVTAENGCKWESVEATRDVMNWTQADIAYNHAKNNHLMFRYHVFSWGSQYPKWLEPLATDTAAFRAEMLEYMNAVAARYPSIDQIDVLNEQIGTHATGTQFFRDGLGGAGATGYDWMIWLYTQARKRFPNAKLVMNDYGLENDANAINTMLTTIKILRDRGLIDGFGTQAHCFNVDQLAATPALLTTRLDLMATSGLPIYITELDLNGGTILSEATQLTSYQNLFPKFWEHPAVAGITLWGYVEGSTWKTGTGLLNSNGTERSCMTWLKSYLSGRTDVGYPFCPAIPCATVVPTVTSPVTYIQNSPATVLTASGTNLKWYSDATSQTALPVAPIPSTTATGATNYYVSQTVGVCESQRAIIVVIVNPLTQTIVLKKGWNLISFNVTPSDMTIENVFSTVLSNVVEVKNADGFWRNGQAILYNSLNAISDGEAYFVFVNADCSLEISGIKTALPLIKSLKLGWNFLGFPSQVSIPISTFIGAKPINVVKNLDGFWQSNGSTNSITTFDPGKGYFIKATGATSVSF